MKQSEEDLTKPKTTTAKKGVISLYIKITALVTAITILLTILGTFIAYPTQSHRDISAQLSQLNEQAYTEGLNTTVYETNEYKKLANTNETMYSTGATIATVSLQFIISIVFVGLIYNYLRKHFISKTRRALGATVVINVVANVVAYLVTIPVVAELSATAALSLENVLISSLLSALFSSIVFFLAATVFERRYEKKHSFIVE